MSKMTFSFTTFILFFSTMLAIKQIEATPQYYHFEKRITFSNENSASTTKTEASTTKTTTKAATTKATTTKATTTKAATTKAATTHAASSEGLTSLPIVSSTTMTSISPMTTSSTSTLAATPTSAASTTSSGGISGGAIGGIVAAIVIIIAGIVAYLFVRRRANQKQRINNNPRFSKAALQTPMQQSYQHQYGTNMPQSPPFAFEDVNQPTIQQYQPAIAESYYQGDTHHEIAPGVATATHYNTTNELVNTAATTTTTAATAAAATTAAAASLQPTQPGSLGVYTVVATYTPTLSDEIDIQTGDQVEVLAEYDDGWCQGINLTRGNAKGVFPKHCTNFGSTQAPSIHSAKRVSSMYIG